MSFHRLDDDEVNMLDLYIRLNRPNRQAETFHNLPQLTPLTPAQLAIIAEPETTFLLPEDQRPETLRASQFLNDFLMDDTEVPIDLNQVTCDGLNAQQIPTSTNIIAPQTTQAPSTQPQFGNNVASDKATIGNKEVDEESISKKNDGKKRAPRYDRMYKCVICDTRDMELTAAKAHISKYHEGWPLSEVMVRQPNKYRKTLVME